MDFPSNLSTSTPWIDGASVVVVAVSVAKAFEWFDGLISDKSRVPARARSVFAAIAS